MGKATGRVSPSCTDKKRVWRHGRRSGRSSPRREVASAGRPHRGRRLSIRVGLTGPLGAEPWERICNGPSNPHPESPTRNAAWPPSICEGAVRMRRGRGSVCGRRVGSSFPGFPAFVSITNKQTTPPPAPPPLGFQVTKSCPTALGCWPSQCPSWGKLSNRRLLAW